MNAPAIPTMGLEQGTQAALAHDLDRQVALGQIELAESRKRAALRALWPSVSLSYQRQASRLTGEVENPDRLIRLESSQILWDGGRTALSGKIEELSASIEREGLAGHGLEVRSRHRSLYFEALRRKQDLTNALVMSRLAGDQSQVAREEYRLGQITESDLLELEGREKEARKAHLAATVAWRGSLREWRLLVGAPAESPVEVRGQLATDYAFRAPPSNFAALAEWALSRRIENRRLELERLKADGEDRLEKLAFLPTVKVSVYGQVSGLDRKQAVGEGGVSLSLRSTFLGNVLEATYGVDSKRNLGGMAESQSARFGLLEDLSATVSRLERDQNARFKNETARRERAALVSRIRDEGEALLLGYRTMEILAEEEDLWRRRLAVMGLRVDLGEARRTDWMEQWVKYQEQRSARSAACAEFVARLSRFEILTGVGVGGFGLIREVAMSGKRGEP